MNSKFKVTLDDRHQFESSLARRHAAILVLVLSVVLSELREGVDVCDALSLCLKTSAAGAGIRLLIFDESYECVQHEISVRSDPTIAVTPMVDPEGL